jgi:signal transduction histidine kinase
MSDEELPAYHELKQKLIRVAQVNTDVTSVYVTGFRNGDIFFYADSVASGLVDEATPGLVYDEATPLFKTVFTVGRTVFEGPISDRWGSWVSSLVPVFEPATGLVIASVGLDIDSLIYKKNVAIATLVPMLLFGVVFLLGLVGYVRYRKNKEVLTLRAKFVSIASHELRSPVSGIVWAAQSLLGRADAALSAGAREIITQIEKTSRQILGTVGEILDLSKLQGAEANRVVMNGVDITALVKEILQSLALVAQQAGIRVRLDDSMPAKLMVLCDKEKTQRVISNIVTNALKYSKQNGEVVIGYRHEDGMHTISIQDDGVGIPEGEQGKIFQSNFRASNVERSLIAGTGIGLHLVKELMERQGGSVRFTSKPGAGTTFYIQLKDR